MSGPRAMRAGMREGSGDRVADEAWDAGYEMGRLAAQLAARRFPARVGLTIREVNRDAAQALAGRHDYDLCVRDGVESGFLWAEFRPRHRARH